jgi:cytochrome c
MIAKYSKPAITAGALALAWAATGAVHAEGNPQRGAMVYRACAACHSLEPGLHLTGPSLADLWGKKAASVSDFPRYSKALEAREFVWDETTLNAWIAKPAEFVAGSRMTFRGIEDERTRQDLMAFLRLAMAPGGSRAVVAQRLVSEAQARGQTPADLSEAGPAEQVAAVRYCRNSYFVTTADGEEHSFWALNLRLKVDSSPLGPKGGKPVLTGSGMQGDRASLVFSDPAQISASIRSKC